MHPIQVDKEHYSFGKYIHKKRWMSIWYQLDEVLSLAPRSVLEVGPGTGVFKVLACQFGVPVETVDIDPELKPDYLASVTNLPFKDESYDCVCGFQILEHLPYEQSLKAFDDMVRVAKYNIIVSLPDAKNVWLYAFHIPKMGVKYWLFPKPKFRGEHYWEINKRGYSLQKIIDDFCKSPVKLQKTYRVLEHPYNRFFIFKKI
jgi:ubiquinone/menaquinone biosynthesis C-methylase UbiE